MADQPVEAALAGGLVAVRAVDAGLLERQQNLRGVVAVGVELVGELEVPAPRLDIGPLQDQSPLRRTSFEISQSPAARSESRT